MTGLETRHEYITDIKYINNLWNLLLKEITGDQESIEIQEGIILFHR